MSLKLLSDIKCFGGYLKRFSHQSSTTACEMKFTIYLPPAAQQGKVPVLYYLSGLTCTDENFITKAGAQRDASEKGIALVAPDTSPRGVNIEGEDDAYDFGSGAGFYVDATENKWSKHYNMYSYVTQELPEIINSNFPVHADKQSITGHSMGGHGALICALKNPGKYKSVSAFSPISNPMECPWGKKAFTGYLGDDTMKWKQYDATELVGQYQGPSLNLLVDQGTADNFYKDKQLLTENLMEACKKANITADIRLQEGYDHSYFFISTFIPDHIAHHAKYLQ